MITVQSSSTIACYAKLIGPNQNVYYLTRPRATLGRRTLYPPDTLYEDGTLLATPDIAIGDARTISRIHATLHYNIGDPYTPSHWAITCHSRNGLLVDGLYVGRETGPFTLRSRSLLQVGEFYWYFLLPNEGGKYVDCMVRPAPVCYVPQALVLRSAKKDEVERVAEREEQRKKERAERAAKLALESATASPSTLPHHLTSVLPPPPPPAVSGWSRTERDVIKELAVQWPIARMDKILDGVAKAGIKREDEEVETFVVTLVAAIMKMSDASTIRQLRVVVPKAAALLYPAAPATPAAPRQPPPAPTPLLSSLMTWHSLLKNHTVYSKRITSLNYLHNQMTDRGSLYLLTDLVSAPRGRLPAHWWGDQWCDEDLLLGIYKWGYGRWEEMRSDKGLRFWKMLEEIKAKKRAAGDDGDEQMGDEMKDEFADEDEEMDEGDDDDDDLGGEGQSAKRKKQKLSTGSRSSSPIPSGHMPANVSKGKTADGWPIPLALVGRFRQLLKVMKTRDDSEAKRGGVGSRRRLVTKDGWSEDERSVFIKALLMYGGSRPQRCANMHVFWQEMRQVWPALARQSDESMTKRLEALKTEATELLSLLNRQQVIDTKREQMWNILASFFTEPHQPIVPPHLTPISAHQLLEHLRHFDMSHRFVHGEERPIHKPLSVNIPEWWNKGQVDDWNLVSEVEAVGWRMDQIDMGTISKDGGAETSALVEYVREVGPQRGMTALVTRWMEVLHELATVNAANAQEPQSSDSKSSTSAASGVGGNSGDQQMSKVKPQPKPGIGVISSSPSQAAAGRSGL